MFELFYAYLDHIVTPERKKIYKDACEALVSIGMVEHGLQIDQQISLAEDGDTEIFLHSVDELLTGVLQQVIGEFGIQLEEQVTLAQMTDVLKSLLLIDNWDDPETIYAYCQAPEGLEAALADILQLMGAFDASTYMTILKKVNPALLDRIAALTSVERQQPLPDALQVDRARSRLTQFLAKSTEPLLIQHAVMNMARLGTPFSELVEPYRHVIDQQTPERAALELVGFLLASDAEESQFKEQLAHESELLFTDVATVTKLDQAAAKLLKDFSHAQA